MKLKLLMYTLSALVLFIPVLAAKQKKSELYILATLYRRHENTAIYDTAKLKQIIESIKPDVLVVDVTPKELKEEKVHASKIEYTNVVFPLIKRGGYRVYPAEPDEPLFSEIVNDVIKSMNDFKAAQPSASAALKRIDDDTFEALKSYWKAPADVNSDFTDVVLHGRKNLQMRLNGIEVENKKWNRHTVEVTLKAIKENPGKRVLLLAGIDNCFEIRNMVRSNKEVNLVDMEKWLSNKNNF